MRNGSITNGEVEKIALNMLKNLQGNDTKKIDISINGDDKVKDLADNLEKADKLMDSIQKKGINFKLGKDKDVFQIFDEKKMSKSIQSQLKQVSDDLTKQFNKIFKDQKNNASSALSSLQRTPGKLSSLEDTNAKAYNLGIQRINGLKDKTDKEKKDIANLFEQYMKVDQFVALSNRRIKTAKSSDHFDTENVVKYVDALQDAIKGQEALLELQEKLRSRGFSPFTDTKTNEIKNSLEKNKNKYSEYQDSVYDDYFGPIIKFIEKGELTEKQFTAYLNRKTRPNMSVDIDALRQIERESGKSLKYLSEAKQYIKEEAELRSELEKIANGNKLKKGVPEEEKRFAGYLTAYVARGGDRTNIFSILKTRGILSKDNTIEDFIDYYEKGYRQDGYDKGAVISEKLRNQIIELTEKDMAARKDLESIYAEKSSIGMSDVEIKIFDEIDEKYENVIEKAKALRKALDIFKNIRSGDSASIENDLMGNDFVSTYILQGLTGMKTGNKALRKSAIDTLLGQITTDTISTGNDDQSPIDTESINEAESEVNNLSESERIATQRANELAKALSSALGVNSKKVISEISANISDILSGGSTNYTDVFQPLLKDMAFLRKIIGDTHEDYFKLVEYVRKSTIKTDPSFSKEFGDDYLNVRNIIGSNVIRKSGKNNISDFLTEINQVLGTTFNVTGNPADDLRQLYEAMNPGNIFSYLLEFLSQAGYDDQYIKSLISNSNQKRKLKIKTRQNNTPSPTTPQGSSAPPAIPPQNPNTPSPRNPKGNAIKQTGYIGSSHWSETNKIGFAGMQTTSYKKNKDGSFEAIDYSPRFDFEKLKKEIFSADKLLADLLNKQSKANDIGISTPALDKKIALQRKYVKLLEDEMEMYGKSGSYALDYNEFLVERKKNNEKIFSDIDVKNESDTIRKTKLFDTESAISTLDSYARILDKKFNSIINNKNLQLSDQQIDQLTQQYDAAFNLIDYIRNDVKTNRNKLTSSDKDMIQRSIMDVSDLGQSIQDGIRKAKQTEKDKTKVDNQLNSFIAEIAGYDNKYLNNSSIPIKQSDLDEMKSDREDLEKYIRSFIGSTELSPQDLLNIKLKKDSYKASAMNVQRENNKPNPEREESYKREADALKELYKLREANAVLEEKNDKNQSAKIARNEKLIEDQRKIILNEQNRRKNNIELSDSEQDDKLEKLRSDLLSKYQSNRAAYNEELKESIKLSEEAAYKENKAFDDKVNKEREKSNAEAYDSELSKIKELYDARSKLNELYAKQEGAKNDEDYTDLIDKQINLISELEVKAKDAINRIESMKDASEIDASKFFDAKKLYDESSSGSAESQNKYNNAKAKSEYEEEARFINDVVSAFKDYIANYNTLISQSKKGINADDWEKLGRAVDDSKQKLENYLATLKTKYDLSTLNEIKKRLSGSFTDSPQDLLKSALNSYIDQINTFEKGLVKTGNIAQSEIELMKSHLSNLILSVDSGDNLTNIILQLNEFANRYQDAIKRIKDVNKSQLDLIDKKNSISSLLSGDNSLAKEEGKIKEYYKIIEKFNDEYNKLIYSYSTIDENGNILFNYDDIGELYKELDGLEKRIKDFQKKSAQYDVTNSKGAVFEGSLGNVTGIDSLRNALESYIEQLQNVNLISTKVSGSGDKITATLKEQDGAIRTVTAYWDKNLKAMRVSESVSSKQSSGFFGGTLKELGNSITMTLDVMDVVSKVRSEFSKGLDVLKQYDSALTNISYTMNMSKESLSDLGESAINMAEDLSMSLEDAMSIYQIYANMNTTTQEIQDTAAPTAILSNLSGVDAATASDQVQGILQQFNMLEDSSQSVADVSMHIVDVLDNISANVAIDYAKGIGIMSDAVQAAGAEAYQAGLSFEQLAALSAKVAERTRDDGSSIGNAIKTIIVRLSKVGKMPAYADEVSNEELSNASKSLNEIGIQVYDSTGAFRELDVILGELNTKWDSLTDAQKSNISYNIAATRQTSKFKNMLEAWVDSMDLAEKATVSQGNALKNQEKYEESFNGRMQQISTQMDKFWINLLDSQLTSNVLSIFNSLAEGLNSLSESFGAGKTAAVAFIAAVLGASKLKQTIQFIFDLDNLKNIFGKVFALYGCESIVA